MGDAVGSGDEQSAQDSADLGYGWADQEGDACGCAVGARDLFLVMVLIVLVIGVSGRGVVG
jgi:hypothetical protein